MIKADIYKEVSLSIIYKVIISVVWLSLMLYYKKKLANRSTLSSLGWLAIHYVSQATQNLQRIIFACGFWS